MSDGKHKAEQPSGTRSDVPTSQSKGAGARTMSFDCCRTRMGEAMDECPCGPIMRRHPIITAAILAVMGLAALLIPAGAIMGILAFLRTI